MDSSQKNMNGTEADWKVAADCIEKQYQKVRRSLDGLVEISRILGFSLCKSSRTVIVLRELGKHITWLGETRSSDCVCLVAGPRGEV